MDKKPKKLNKALTRQFLTSKQDSSQQSSKNQLMTNKSQEVSKYSSRKFDAHESEQAKCISKIFT
jgi:hypothetical protein